MSNNKGAIKKTDAKDGQSRSRSKASLPNQSNTDGTKNSELERTKVSQLASKRGAGDTRVQIAQNSTSSKTHSRKNEIKDTTKVTQRRTVKPINVSTTSKTSLANATSNRHEPIKATTNPKTRLGNIKKSTNTSNTERSKSKEKSQKGYSEKRGLSTIFMPKSYSNKLNSNNKSVEKSMISTRDKEKLTGSEKPTKTVSNVEVRQRKNSRTLSPSEVKVLRSAVSRVPSQDTMQNDAILSVKSSKDDNYDDEDDDYNYEDDFEDYESDFQECTDSDASQVSEENYEREIPTLDPIQLHSREVQKTAPSFENHKPEEDLMHDSGHYELAEARKRAARIELMNANPILPQLTEPVNKAYSEERPLENKSLPSSADEGFEDSRSGDFIKSPPLSQISFIDFRKSKEDTEVKKPMKSKSRKRGEELLEMIKLDTMGWSLLECTPVPYEEFIRSYGKLNTQQTSTQTNEDNLDVEIQTNEISCKNKWTQFPITCHKNLRTKKDIDLFRVEQVGVGNDDNSDIENLQAPTYDVLQLNDFVTRAGSVMLLLLEERKFGGNIFRNDQDELPFSDGCVRLSVDSVTFLAGRTVTMIHYSEVVNKILLTIHSPAEEEIETSSKQDYVTDCCIGCVWNISEPSTPTKLFYSPCPITACCFHLTSYNIVLAGLEDGSISLWDLKEDEMWHQKVTDKDNNVDWIIRSPTYTTSGNTEMDGHNSKIVAIRILSKIETNLIEKRNNKFVPLQICTLDEEGALIIWSVLSNMNVNINDLGLSQWGEMRIVKSEAISLKRKNGLTKNNIDLFIDMHIDSVDNNNIYVATNTTSILHATCIGNRTSMYKKSEIDPCGITTCIERCPFKQSYFLVGCDDGTIRLHTLNIERPIAQFHDDKNTSKIKMLRWSKSKPFTIYALDNNSRIHTWDLSYSDMFPVHSVSVRKWGAISSMELSPCRTEHDLTNQYLALGTDVGVVEVHKLSKDFYYSKMDDVSREIDTFMRYVKIL